VVDHSPTSRNFQFVNATKASGTKDKTAQKLVRSYVTKRYWQLQREEDTALTRRQDPQFLPASFRQVFGERCTCPLSQAVDTTTLNERPNFSQLQRISDIPIAVLTASNNIESSPQLSVVTSSSTGLLCSFCGRSVSPGRSDPRHLPPLQIMRVGNSDPFSSFPIETQTHMHELIDHCEYYMLCSDM
jgi:hypothetical protein